MIFSKLFVFYQLLFLLCFTLNFSSVYNDNYRLKEINSTHYNVIPNSPNNTFFVINHTIDAHSTFNQPISIPFSDFDSSDSFPSSTSDFPDDTFSFLEPSSLGLIASETNGWDDHKGWGGKWDSEDSKKHSSGGWGVKKYHKDHWGKHSDNWGKKNHGSNYDSGSWNSKGWKDHKKGDEGKKASHWSSGKKGDHWKEWGDKTDYKKDKGHGYVKSYSWDKEKKKHSNWGSKGGHWKDWNHGDKKSHWENHEKKNSGHWKHNNYKKGDHWKQKNHGSSWGDWGKYHDNGDKWSHWKDDSDHHWKHREHKWN